MPDGVIVVWPPRLKTLDEHNAQRMEQHRQIMKAMEPHANGIACPECEGELWDSNPSVLLSSNPPKKCVHCPKCGYRGFRLE